MATPEQLLAARSGLVVAPAGCGKTCLLVDTVAAARGGRTLVLTHTRAGVAVIRQRLTEAAVKPSQYRLATLDNWCGWLASRFPRLSDYVPTNTSVDYRNAKRGTLRVLESDAVRTAISATYDRVLVDEYQDCSKLQHDIILRLGEALPVIALGDPMQHVFDFNEDGTPPWTDVCAAFATTWTLNTPWRWKKVEEHAFGEWILRQRAVLEAGGCIDLRSGPDNVKWLPLPPDATLHYHFHQQSVPRPARGSTVFVLNSRTDTSGRRRFARDGAGLSVVENADLPDLMRWALTFERVAGTDRIVEMLRLAHDVMSGVDASSIIARLNTLRHHTDCSAGSDEDRVLLALASSTGVEGLCTTLQAMAANRAVHRPELMEAFCQAATLANRDGNRALSDAAAHVRDRRASQGRKLGPRSVGSTLLLKGMEADHTVVIEADSMKANDLYVAISRASRSLTVVSRSPLLPVPRG